MLFLTNLFDDFFDAVTNFYDNFFWRILLMNVWRFFLTNCFGYFFDDFLTIASFLYILKEYLFGFGVWVLAVKNCGLLDIMCRP